jgi:hypothetical protein
MSIYNFALFKATHNSYSGNLGGQRCGSIVQQLEQGVRLIELDLHVDDYPSIKDYQIGHNDGPGSIVWHADGNPASNLFAEWAGQVATWSAHNPHHVPLQLMLDPKDTFDLPSAAAGNYAALNERLEQIFGTALLKASAVKQWPDVSAMLGKILVVLSNTLDKREPYVRDRGVNPSVCVNSKQQVVEVHESEAGNHSLWYWTGKLSANGTVTWQRHGRYGTGTTAAVALNDDGWIVEVHKSQDHDRLWYQVGRLTTDLDIAWGEGKDYDAGVLPTIQFDSPASYSLREIHHSQAHNQNWSWNAALKTAGAVLTLTANKQTNDPRWNSARSGSVSVESGADHLLAYRTPSAGLEPIRYEPVIFIDYQMGDPIWVRQQSRFAAAPADGSTDFLLDARRSGMVTRGWQFKDTSPRLSPPENYLATDFPFDPWYQSYCASIGVLT